MSALISLLRLSLEGQLEIINSLNLSLEEKEVIINGMAISIEDKDNLIYELRESMVSKKPNNSFLIILGIGILSLFVLFNSSKKNKLKGFRT